MSLKINYHSNDENDNRANNEKYDHIMHKLLPILIFLRSL